MIDIQINVATDLVIPIPQSSSGDTVTYEIFDSDGTVIDSGSMTFVRDEIWKVSDFTPDAYGTLTLKANDTTITSKREEFYRVVGSLVESHSGDWGADLEVCTNSFVSGDEAEEYFANRFGASSYWDELTDAQKKAAIITAYNQLVSNQKFSLPSAEANVTAIVKKANCEMALFVVQFQDDIDRRKSLQAQGVTAAGIVKESYADGAGEIAPIPPIVLKMLEDYKVAKSGYMIGIERDEDEDVS